MKFTWPKRKTLITRATAKGGKEDLSSLTFRATAKGGKEDLSSLTFRAAAKGGKKNLFSLTIIIIIGLLLIFSLNFFQKEVKGFFYFISSPIQKTLWRAGDGVSDFFELITEIKNLKREADEHSFIDTLRCAWANEELKLKNQELISQIAQLVELKKENKVLREALEIGLEKEFKLSLAEVVSKDISQDSILINKGSKDGIANNSPVITQQKTLVGKIGEVYENFSRVILISNKESSFDAKILAPYQTEGFGAGSDPENDISGVVNGKGNLQLFLDFVPQEKEIKEGDFIVTTSLGGIFPKGLLVGQIGKVLRSDIEPFQQAKIRPAFDIRELETVFIITDF